MDGKNKRLQCLQKRGISLLHNANLFGIPYMVHQIVGTSYMVPMANKVFIVHY